MNAKISDSEEREVVQIDVRYKDRKEYPLIDIMALPVRSGDILTHQPERAVGRIKKISDRMKKTVDKPESCAIIQKLIRESTAKVHMGV